MTFKTKCGMIIHTNHTQTDIKRILKDRGNKFIMKTHDNKYAWMVKIGEKGQFVIPKEARELFELAPGDEIIVLGDPERGIAILPKRMQGELLSRIFSDMNEKEEGKENE